MIKKVIFDLDDTLIINTEESINDYQLVLKKHNMPDSHEDALNLYKCIGNYELIAKRYDKVTLLDFINKNYNSNLGVGFVEDIIDVVGKWSKPASKQLIDTLEYLSSKYDIYLLSNWFIKSQVERLKIAGIYKYFKECIGAEEYVKPSVESYQIFFKDCLPSECVMIGDSYKFDIEVPIKLGMKAILCNFKNRKIEYQCTIINNWHEIKNIL